MDSWRTVFRVQAQDHPICGFYAATGGITVARAFVDLEKTGILPALVPSEKHPPPGLDGLAEVRSSDYFGFSSWDQLERWFPLDVRCKIADKHTGSPVVIVQYRVPAQHVRDGRRQVVFPLAEATEVARYDFVEALPLT